MMNVIEASGLGKRYGSTWALRECTLAIPAGHVAALVGPNGAGKTTPLNLAVGLANRRAAPSPCRRSAPPVTGRAGRHRVRRRGHPLYKNLPLADMLHLTSDLNRRFDGLRAGPARRAGHPAEPQGREAVLAGRRRSSR